MSRHDEMVVIATAITDTVTVTYVKRQALLAHKCVSCGRFFRASPHAHNDSGVLSWQFDKGPLARQSGLRVFTVMACSFRCVDAVVDGKWLQLPEYHSYATIGARLVQIRYVHDAIMYEEELRAQWNMIPDGQPPREDQVVFHFAVVG